MAQPPLVATADLEAWLGASFSVSEATRAGAVLSAVSSLVRSEAGLTWVTDTGTLGDVPDDVEAVVLQVAARVFTNPANLRQESIGSYSASYRDWEGLSLTAFERSVLGRYRVNQRGLWSLSTTRNDPYADTVYVPIEGTTAEFPWYSSDIIL